MRNSGVQAVVEAVGDHGCEYMTGGRVVVLGPTGRNFAAGMSGGVAYVLDEEGDFPTRCNKQMVSLEKLVDPEEIEDVRKMVQRHGDYTKSERAWKVLALWDQMTPKFVKVMPKDYKRVLDAIKRAKEAGLSGEEAINGPSNRTRATSRALAAINHADARTQISSPSARSLTNNVMGKPTGFLDFKRELPSDRDAKARVGDWQEFHHHMPEQKLRDQGARCMDCGIPFCHTGSLLGGMASGCPINNLIPEWNDLVYRGLWKEALERLHKTNNFPEFTGRVCPAPCEGSCVLGINEPPVTIKNIECAIIDKGFDEGWVTADPPKTRTGKKVAVVGSGPAGLCRGRAAQLRGPLGDGVRARRPHRRVVDVRHPEHEARQTGRATPR